MKDVPRSAQFDDIYFSAENGLAETDHVFIKGNALPQAWEGKTQFTICETGFGTGLNFLSAWKLFEKTAKSSQTLDFISFEKYPLTSSEIKAGLEPWAEYFGKRLDILCDEYPLRVAGFHRIKISPQVTLTLIFDDVNDALPQLNAVIDCWFLDGFAPAKNPDMWRDILFQNMARISSSGASFATFTAAGDVRRGLEGAGFSVQKQKGFGRKRDMIVGKFEAQGRQREKVFGKHIAIVGGGLAGTASAYVLKQYGFDPVIYEREEMLAQGASGNSIGLYNPRFTAQRDDVSDFFSAAYAQLIRLAKKAGEEIEYNPCGALHLINTPEKEKRFKAVIRKWMWNQDHVKLLTAEQAGDISGVKIETDCLYLSDAGSVSPYKLCHYMARDIEVKYLKDIGDLSLIEADAVLLCNAYAAKDIIDWLPLVKVRGQMTEIETPPRLENLKCNIHYSGYLSASRNGTNAIGATFDKWTNHQDVTEQDHQKNITKLMESLPFLQGQQFKIRCGRARFRAEPHDHFPLVGNMPDEDNVFIATAFGSYGVVSAIQSAHYIADFLRGGSVCLPERTVKALAPQRFLDRMFKKQAKMD